MKVEDCKHLGSIRQHSFAQHVRNETLPSFLLSRWA